MSSLVEIILSDRAELRDRALFDACKELSRDQLLAACEELEIFWKSTDNLYHRVRALFFLYAIHRFILPSHIGAEQFGPIPYEAYQHLLSRRFNEAIATFLTNENNPRLNDTMSSGLAQAYMQLGLQNLADQVRRCVRGVPGNQWMFRAGHPLDFPLHVRPELMQKEGVFPVLNERTAVRMDLSHSSWSDIFFLGMDRPEFARVINISINLALKGTGEGPQPPVQAFFRVIDAPVIRLVSIDLECQATIDSFSEIFDFGRDHLGLLKAAVIAAGMVPPGMEGSDEPISLLLERMIGPGLGFELVSSVENIPKGSRLAVSTNLLAALIAVCMRATRQVQQLTGPLAENERRLIAARAILGEWLGGSGGGWQDSGGVWPGIKLIEGCFAEPGDKEHGVSRGKLLPRHTVFDPDTISVDARNGLQQSLILVHGGLAQNVGPILEMVTERYLLRTEEDWQARLKSLAITDSILAALKAGDIRKLGQLTTEHFFGPLKQIIPWASNAFTESVIEQVRSALGSDFWGFWMLGGMSGGGMGFIVAPERRESAKLIIHEILLATKKRMEHALPFAMNPVIYDFAINDEGSCAHWSRLFPSSYYRFRLNGLLQLKPNMRNRTDQFDLESVACGLNNAGWSPGVGMELLSGLLPEIREGQRDSGRMHTLEQFLEENGFDSVEHESIRSELQSGKIGIAQNRLRQSVQIDDVSDHDLLAITSNAEAINQAEALLNEGRVAVVTLAAGAGSRWTQGAGVVKALHPFALFAGKHRNFIELHLAKSRRTKNLWGCHPQHVFTTSYLTHDPIQTWFSGEMHRFQDAPIHLSRGQSVGLRFVPTIADLRFAWEVLPQQQLDDQSEKVRRSVRKALMDWAHQIGEASDYRDNLPLQCMHPVGHWYEVPNMLLNGTLATMLEHQPGLEFLLIHNIDTLGATLDPVILGSLIESKCDLAFEVISRRIEDHGGGLARVDGKPRLIEGLALPTEKDEFRLRYYNTATSWIRVPSLLRVFELEPNDLADKNKVRQAVRRFGSRMPTYLTLKEVKKRWGRGHEDIYPVLQFERLWGDMSAVPELDTRFLRVSRLRGQQLKEQSQLDGWLRDGSANGISGLCDWTFA
jgi:hypothetical protein